jgi:four helix bundle protein
LLKALAAGCGTGIVAGMRMSHQKRMSVRTSELQCAVIDEYRRATIKDDAERGLWIELLKSVRSLANNSAESGGSQSRQDFIQKFHLCLKEGREILQLLAALIHASPNQAFQLEQLARACDQIVAILVTSLKTAKANEQADMRRRQRLDRP